MTEPSAFAAPSEERLPAEPQDIANYLSLRVADQQLRCVIRLAGRVDADRLSRATRLALEAEPVLGCRFVADDHRPYWERRPDIDVAPLCELVQTADVDADLSDFLAGPLDPSRDPLTLVRVLRGSSWDTVALKLSHVVSDVGGLKDYLTLLTSLYRRLGEEPDYSPKRRSEGRRGQEQVFRAVPREVLGNLTKQMSSVQPIWGFPVMGRDISGAAIASRRIERPQLAALRKRGRELGATVNDVFLAALFRALVATLRPGSAERLAIQTTVDLRRYLTDGRAGAICNLSAIVYPTIAAEAAATWESALSAVVESTSSLKARYPGIAVAAYLEGAFRADFQEVLRGLQTRSGAAATGRAHPMLTNFGVLSDECVDFGEPPTATATLYGPSVYPPGFALGLSTFRGELTCAVVYPPRSADGKTVERVLDLVVDDLATQTS